MKLIGLILLLTAQISYASDRVGNGGDVLTCNEPDGESVYVLDEYEGKYNLAIGGKDLDYEEKVIILLERIKKHFPTRYNLYISFFNRFRSRVTFIKTGLPEIDDASEQVNPVCSMRQAAYFKRGADNQYNYYIQKDIWDFLTNDQKAVLVFHEILYTEAVGLGHDSSLDVRRANRMVFTDDKLSVVAFDEAFIQPLRAIPRTASLVVQQLQNAYSEGVAIHLLQYDLSEFYADKNLSSALMTLRTRFNARLSVVLLVDERLKEIGF